MMPIQLKRTVTAAMGAFVMLSAASARAATIGVTVDTSFLNGLPAILAFDFIDGGPPDNTVTLSAITSDGTPGSTSTSGNVTGSGPWVFSDAGGSFQNELLVGFNPMGTSASFSFTTTDNPPPLGLVPDAFSMYVLDSSGTFLLITTNDPADANALFLFNIGEGFEQGGAFTPNEAGFSITVTPAQIVPEPASVALVLSGAVAWIVGRRRHRSV